MRPAQPAIVPRRGCAEMTGAAAHPGEDADVLEAAVGIGEPCADRADAGLQRMRREPVEPAVAQHLHVVVEEDEHLLRPKSPPPRCKGPRS